MRKVSDPPFLKQGTLVRNINPSTMIIRTVSPTGSISSISLREKRFFIRYLNAQMQMECERGRMNEWSMIGLENIESEELYDRLKDGIVFL